MSRRGGAQAKTVAMYARLDQMAQEWVSTWELAFILEAEYGRASSYACRLVNRWAADRGAKVAVVVAGKLPFYCSRKGAALDIGALCKQYWGTLPVYFRRTHDFNTLPAEEGFHATLLAYGALCLGRSDCLAAFNSWAEANHQPRIKRETLERFLP